MPQDPKFSLSRSRGGIALLALIMLLVFVSAGVLGVSVFIVQNLSRAETQRISTATYYLAHAGLQNALYNFRSHDLSGNGYFTKGQTNINATNYFVIGTVGSDTLMVNTSNAAWGGASSRDLRNLQIQNATNSNTITIDRIILTWNNSRTLQQIRINGSNYWTGNALSPVNADLSPNFTLNTTPTIYNVNRFRFSGNMTGATVTAQFMMTDGSSKTITLIPASNNNIFRVKVMGKTTGSPIYRTIDAQYNANTGKIIDYHEINTSLP